MTTLKQELLQSADQLDVIYDRLKKIDTAVNSKFVTSRLYLIRLDLRMAAFALRWTITLVHNNRTGEWIKYEPEMREVQTSIGQ